MMALILILAATNVDEAEKLFQKGFRAQLDSKHEEALEIYQKLLKGNSGGLKKYIHFNVTCIYAVQGKTEAALAELELALKSGYDDLNTLKTDIDLNSIRNTERFRSLLRQARSLRRERLKGERKGDFGDFKPFPFDFDLIAINGKPLRLKDLRGKVVVVDFWGTWCPPCRREIPHLVDLDRRYRKEGLVIVGLNRERQGTLKQQNFRIRDFARLNKIKYLLALCPDHVKNSVPQFSGFPTKVFIDRRGKVRLRVTGYRPQNFLEGAVLTLLDEKTGKESRSAAVDKP